MIAAHILTHSDVGFAGMHLAGFAIERRGLRRELGLETRVTVCESPERMVDAAGEPADIVLVTTDWRARVEDLRGMLRAMRARGAKRLVYLDTFDQTSSPYFGVLGDVDLYVKSKLMRPVSRYAEAFAGGFVVADYCERELGIPLNGWKFGSAPEAGLEGKIVPGWSFAVSRRARLLLRLAEWGARPLAKRKLDLHARIGPPARREQEWYEKYRALGAAAVERLPAEVRRTGLGRVPQRTYLWELMSSRMVFSPFGWGEVCLRDYEAVACGCLLVKPEMGHVATSPDIFVANETYVPVRWDFSDLGEVVRKYLDQPREAERIAANGQRVLREYFRRGGFVGDVRRLLAGVGLA